MIRSVLIRMAVLLGLTLTLVLLACQSGSNGDDTTSSPLDALLARLKSADLADRERLLREAERTHATLAAMARSANSKLAVRDMLMAIRNA